MTGRPVSNAVGRTAITPARASLPPRITGRISEWNHKYPFDPWVKDGLPELRSVSQPTNIMLSEGMRRSTTNGFEPRIHSHAAEVLTTGPLRRRKMWFTLGYIQVCVSQFILTPCVISYAHMKLNYLSCIYILTLSYVCVNCWHEHALIKSIY